MKDAQRFERLRGLEPLAAVRAWLDGDFGIGDELALIEAIRQDRRVNLNDDAISAAIAAAMDEGSDAEACLRRLTER